MYATISKEALYAIVGSEDAIRQHHTLPQFSSVDLSSPERGVKVLTLHQQSVYFLYRGEAIRQARTPFYGNQVLLRVLLA